MLLFGCGSLPHPNGENAINKPLTQESQRAKVAIFPNPPPVKICETTNNPYACNDIFIGIAISGGGSRAANFGLGVIKQLRELGLYDDVTAISAVSGGALAAAAVRKNDIASEGGFNNLANLLRQDFLSKWLIKSSNPYRFLRAVVTSENATSSLADVFDNTIFHGATYESLGSVSKGHPYLYLNSSLVHTTPAMMDITTRGVNQPVGSLQGFTFTDYAFEKLGSSLGKLRLADAVAASGAYPGVFESVTLKNYAFIGKIFGTQYLHLTDGGISDNLGIDALVRAYSEALHSKSNLPCLLILADAHVNDRGDEKGSLTDLRTNPIDYAVSPSILQAFDGLLDRKREEQLNVLGLSLHKDHPVRFQEHVKFDLGNAGFYSSPHGSVQIRSKDSEPPISMNGVRKVEQAYCAVWHVALDRLLELSTDGGLHQREVFGPWYQDENVYKTQKDKDLARLDYFVNAVETNYKLSVNGSSCDEKTIQSSIFEAARVLLREDGQSISSLQKWLSTNGRSDLSKAVDEQIFKTRRRENKLILPEYIVKDRNLSHPYGKWIECTSLENN